MFFGSLKSWNKLKQFYTNWRFIHEVRRLNRPMPFLQLELLESTIWFWENIIEWWTEERKGNERLFSSSFKRNLTIKTAISRSPADYPSELSHAPRNTMWFRKRPGCQNWSQSAAPALHRSIRLGSSGHLWQWFRLQCIAPAPCPSTAAFRLRFSLQCNSSFSTTISIET